MNRTTKTVTAALGAAFIFSVSVGGQCIGAALWWHAAAAYTVAAALLTAVIRELNRAVLPGEYTDDLPENQPADTVARAPAPGPARMGRFRAARAARRETAPDGCTCERWWTSFGAAHDKPCPAYQQSSA
ncbi:hypothetical protein ACKI16_29695 [Streptomyces scabiei]|uniref:hypothetical protein n=1 Tax=Streptomyces scabiei TaxID=1930 RepID=UPI0038F757BA